MKRIAVLIALILSSFSVTADAPENEAGRWYEIIASSADRSYPIQEPMTPAKSLGCCKVCTKGKPCGDTCIAQDKICHVGPGCAC